jgi:hypothetical protein
MSHFRYMKDLQQNTREPCRVCDLLVARVLNKICFIFLDDVVVVVMVMLVDEVRAIITPSTHRVCMTD